MYDIDGERRLTEFELDWLPGYEGSKPVRVGNAASGQFQLDVYGEVIVGDLRRAQARACPATEQAWRAAQGARRVPRGCLAAPGRRHLGGARRAPPLHALEGHGLGRLRSRGAHDRGVRRRRRRRPEHAAAPARAARAHPRRGLRARLQPARRRVHAVLRQRALDASVLVIPHVGFLPASDPRVRGTVAAIEQRAAPRRLRAALRHRARHRRAARHGGRVPRVQLLAGRQLRLRRAASREAEELFERLLALRNHLGPARRGV